MDEPTPPPPAPGAATGAGARRSDSSPWNWLILVPLVVSLTVPIFNRREPTLVGIPFFYWYQVVVIAVGVTSTLLVFRSYDRKG